MSYAIDNKVGSPRKHLLNILTKEDIYSEFPKDGFTQVIKESGYYFSAELLEKNFDFDSCIHGKIAEHFMEKTGYSRPKINRYMEKHGRVVFLCPGYYDIGAFKAFLPTHIKEEIYSENWGRPKNSVAKK